mgnify:CR=1 FL=1
MTTAQKLVLTVLSIAVVVVFGVLAYLLLSGAAQGSGAIAELPRPTPTPTIVYTLEGITFTAKSGYAAAETLALAWQPDAQPASVSADWRPATVEALAQPVAWSYQFYSPKARRIYVVVVQDGEAQAIHEQLVPYPVDTFAPEEWRVDSTEVLTIWLNRGGGWFLARYPAASVFAHLGVVGDDRRWVWRVTGVAERGNRTHTVLVDPVTGAVVR